MKKIISFALVAIMLVAVMLSVTSCSKTVYIGVQSGTTGQYFVDGDADWDFKAQADCRERRCADIDGNADSAYTEHGHGRHS